MQEPGKDQLLRLLDPVKHEWRTIGEMLSIENSDIQCEERNVQHNDTDKLSKILQLWINQRKCEVSWKKIITVIENRPLKNVNLANEICKILLLECKKGIQLTYTFPIDITLYSFLCSTAPAEGKHTINLKDFILIIGAICIAVLAYFLYTS